MASIDDLARDARVMVRRAGEPDAKGRCVVYWMQRSQRGLDNPALEVAIAVGNRLGLPVVAFFAPIPWYPRANSRHYAFLAQGIGDIRREVEARNVGFVLRRFPDHSLDRFLEEMKPAMVVSDENPMREPEHWREVVAERRRVPFWTVDADVIVPSKLYEKEIYAAHHMRRRLEKLLPDFLHESERVEAKHRWRAPAGLENLPHDTEITAGWEIERVAAVDSFRGGTSAALKHLHDFVERKLSRYAKERNEADKDGTSKLSPYLHFGQISPLTVALAVKRAKAPQAQKESFFNEMILWRELAINFVKYNKHYDSIACAERWARESLAEHAKDEREHVYSKQQFESAETHDELWNAAQRQMVRHGYMHNYMRMYWAKKMVEWSRSPQVAYRMAVELNDKYFLDGRDPNGYMGIAWAMVGKKDRPWFDRPVIGKVRMMARSGAERKFDVEEYIRAQEPGLF